MSRHYSHEVELRRVLRGFEAESKEAVPGKPNGQRQRIHLLVIFRRHRGHPA
jgi:hypothetical protein